MNKCIHCGYAEGDCDGDVELRPYGPRGAMICFECMMATPDREAEAKRNFGAQLDACGPIAVCDGSEVGPYPLESASAEVHAAVTKRG